MGIFGSATRNIQFPTQPLLYVGDAANVLKFKTTGVLRVL